MGKIIFYIVISLTLFACKQPDIFAIDPNTHHSYSLPILEKDDSVKLQQYINEGIDVNAKDGIGNTLLMNAAYHNAVKCARLLIKENASVDVIGFNGETPLMMACHNSYDIATILIEAGANVNAKNRFGNCPLNFAIWECKYDTTCLTSEKLVKLLIAKGANVNSVTSLSTTPLDAARFIGATKIDSILVKYGAVEGK